MTEDRTQEEQTEDITQEVFDFTLGTHPISTKGTTESGEAKRRSACELVYIDSR
jgi:hypothetical protein